MYIKMDKQSENLHSVSYRFQSNIPGKAYQNPAGELRWFVETKKGLCIFNKSTEKFELLTTETDSYFLEKDNWEVIKVHARLIKLKRENLGYPDSIDIAIG